MAGKNIEISIRDENGEPIDQYMVKVQVFNTYRDEDVRLKFSNTKGKILEEYEISYQGMKKTR